LRLCSRWDITLSLAILFCGAAVVTPAAAQSSPPASGSDKSIAAAVRDAKAQKTSHAKRVFTDDDMDTTTTAVPRLRVEGAENCDDILAAIGKYKLTHTPAQTEAAVRACYDRYNEQLAAAIQENLDLKTLSEANTFNGYELCRQSADYEKCESRSRAEFNGAQPDKGHDRQEHQT
jgi:hypothetical protein